MASLATERVLPLRGPSSLPPSSSSMPSIITSEAPYDCLFCGGEKKRMSMWVVL